MYAIQLHFEHSLTTPASPVNLMVKLSFSMDTEDSEILLHDVVKMSSECEGKLHVHVHVGGTCIYMAKMTSKFF